MSTHLVFNDRHAQPGIDLSYHDWIGKLIIDVKPDVVVDNGDGWDMPSLCSYDRNTRAFHGRTYKADIDAGLEAIDRIWGQVKAQKKKMPRRVYLIGNHEQRIERALDLSPELQGTITLDDLDLDNYYTDVVPYAGSTPGVIEIDQIYYAHYFVSGIKGLPISGEHPAHTLLIKQNASCTVGHSHIFDFSRKTGIDGRIRQGLVNGWCGNHRPAFAGNAANLWWSGVAIKRNVHQGNYDLEMVSMDALRKEYGNDF